MNDMAWSSISIRRLQSHNFGRGMTDLTEPQQARPALGNNSSTRAVVPSCAKTRIEEGPREEGILDRGPSVPGGVLGDVGGNAAYNIKQRGAEPCSSAPLSPSSSHPRIAI